MSVAWTPDGVPRRVLDLCGLLPEPTTPDPGEETRQVNVEGHSAKTLIVLKMSELESLGLCPSPEQPGRPDDMSVTWEGRGGAEEVWVHSDVSVLAH